MLTPHDVNSRVQQSQHLVAPLNALCVVFQLASANVGSGKVHGVQKLINAVAIFNLKGVPHLLNGKLQVPYGVTVILQQLPSVMEQGGSCSEGMFVVFFLPIVFLPTFLFYCFIVIRWITG